MSTITAKPAIAFIGLGDQGLPMAIAIAEAGCPLQHIQHTAGIYGFYGIGDFKTKATKGSSVFLLITYS